jgi:hypothetical protein
VVDYLIRDDAGLVEVSGSGWFPPGRFGSELVRGAEAGAVVPPRDPAALAEALRPYLVDPARAGADGRRARNGIEMHCSPDRIAAERELVYEEAVSRWRATFTGRTLTRIGQLARSSSSS